MGWTEKDNIFFIYLYHYNIYIILSTVYKLV